jgi:hypothetical protein
MAWNDDRWHWPVCLVYVALAIPKDFPEPKLLTKETFGNVLGNLILFLIISIFIIGGVVKKIDVLMPLLKAQRWMGCDVKVIPYLVGLLVAIRVFRDSGGLDALTNGIKWLLNLVGLGGDYVAALRLLS